MIKQLKNCTIIFDKQEDFLSFWKFLQESGVEEIQCNKFIVMKDNWLRKILGYLLK